MDARLYVGAPEESRREARPGSPGRRPPRSPQQAVKVAQAAGALGWRENFGDPAGVNRASLGGGAEQDRQ